jgi:Recombinase
LIWGEADGEVLLHPDEAVSGALRAVFGRFTEMGSARQVWLWFRQQGLRFPLQSNALPERWVTPSYTKIHEVLTNPLYAGAYVYGKTRCERYVDESDQYANACAICLAPNGRSSFVIITAASSTGRLLRPTNCGWRKTLIRVPTKLEEQ